jgi:Flp pilus assembly protein TadB
VFGRKKDSPSAQDLLDAGAEKDGGKGRPTPKRSEAERGRRRSITAAPTNRKEAYKLSRERQRAERTRSMQALREGDERALPARDRGPVRKFARDTVDGRRSVAEFFLPLALVILVLTLTGSDRLKFFGSTLWLVLVTLIILDSLLLAFKLRSGLRRALPDQSHKGALPYAMMRSMQIRRFRLPPPSLRGRRARTP